MRKAQTDLEDPRHVALAPGSGPSCPAFSETVAQEQGFRAGQGSEPHTNPSIYGF